MPQDSLANIVHQCFGGSKQINENFRVLVAGGGTGHALIYLAEQLQYFGARVTYIDLSNASMRVAKRRAQNRQLTNIDWYQGSLLDLPQMNLGQFDYINCTGVLHHLPTGRWSTVSSGGAQTRWSDGTHGLRTLRTKELLPRPRVDAATS